jgi:uncharacterized protein (DUF1800 family)
MKLTRRDFLKDMAFATALVGLPAWANGLDELPSAEMTREFAGTYPWQWMPPSNIGQGNPIITALNRIAFGPRPGDFERVQKIGVDAYVDEQLSPESIDDSALDQKLAALYPTLPMSNAELMRDYPRPNPAAQPAPNANQAPGPMTVVQELQEATILRALYSQRQLKEVLVDFWSNHFSIYIVKNDCRWMKTVDDREVIRKYAFGKFKDLLLASAQSPAMLEYLDNRLNVKGVANENYAREIMELHSLGVDGGYTQKDVQELSRALTGWTIVPPRAALLAPDKAGTFVFDPKRHDDGAKKILGVELPAGGGINDALKIIDVLANHPSTARYLSRKLVTRFVADNPPDALVQRAAQTFSQTGGDIRAVLGTILHSDEFKNSFAQKIKRPFELIVSALRATDAQIEDARVLNAALRLMGQGLFLLPTPDGYPDNGAAWINTSGLLARWNLALLVAANRIPRGKVDLQAAMSGASAKTNGAAVEYWVNYVLHRNIPDSDRQKLIKAVGDPSASFEMAKLPMLVALILASPHFQYR